MKNIKKLLIATLILFGVSSCGILNLGKQKEHKMKIETTEGDITLKLYDETPLHRDNFIKLVKSKFYDGVLFHRVIDQFMIQSGDPTSKNAEPGKMLGEGDVGYTIPAEFKPPQLYHKRGVLAAAREGDDTNPEKASSGCQFYIVVGKQFTNEDLDIMEASKIDKHGHANDSTYKFSEQARTDYTTIGGTPHLDGNYTVFGEILTGMDVVDKIAKARTNRADRPREDIRIVKIRRIR